MLLVSLVDDSGLVFKPLYAGMAALLTRISNARLRNLPTLCNAPPNTLHDTCITLHNTFITEPTVSRTQASTTTAVDNPGLAIHKA